MAVETISNLIFTGPLAWTADAACTGQTDLFFAPAGERPEARVVRESRARSICRDCPVLLECRDWARENREYGFWGGDRKSTRLNSSHVQMSYAVFCFKKKNKPQLVVTLHNKKKYIYSNINNVSNL